MATFSIPSQPARSSLVIEEFYGIDYTSEPGIVDVGKSPNAPNMIRDTPGKVRKCMGYFLRAQFPDVVNGYHKRKGDSFGIVHAGTKLYKMPETAEAVPEEIYDGMNNARSLSWQFDEGLYIIDGKQLLVWNGEEAKPVEGKIPTLTIAKAPNGGGTDYDALNLIQPKFTELFLGTATDKAYHLSFSGLDDTPVTAKILNSSGEWVDKKEGTDFSVNRETGVVTFNTAPGESPVKGEDNVSITAARTVEGYADKINKCTIGTLFGVNGAADRLFLSGNPDFVNYDWYSGQNDPTYFPDVGYSILGTAKSAIMGYSIINNYLATHKDENETDRNVIVRSGDLVDNEPAFPIKNTMQGPGAIAKHSFAYLGTEPVFLTRLGVYAITPSDINGERYSQDRSYYMNGALLKESNLENACCAVHRDMYWLALNGNAYILDGLQSLGTTKNEPYSNRQYACFFRTNIPATVMWEEEDTLFFGDKNGRVLQFYTDEKDLNSYNDCGEPIKATWETPDFTGKRFYKNKTFRFLALQLSPAAATSIAIYAQKRGIWSFIKRDSTKARFFSYANLSYSRFTYSNDSTAKTLQTKIRLRRLDKARFRFENDNVNEPFGIMRIAVEYVEGGNYRG